MTLITDVRTLVATSATFQSWTSTGSVGAALPRITEAAADVDATRPLALIVPPGSARP